MDYNLEDSLDEIGENLSELANNNRKRETTEGGESEPVDYVTESEKDQSLSNNSDNSDDDNDDNDLENDSSEENTNVNMNNAPRFSTVPPPVTSTFRPNVPIQDTRKRKLQMFIKIQELNKKHSIAIPYSVSMNSQIDDIQMVLDTMIDSYRKKHAVESYRKMIVTGTTVIEWLNTKYDPFDFHLKGWSESVYKSVEASEYDEVFEELHEKYKSDSQMSPEMRLLMLLAGSAFMHHTFSKTNDKLNGLFGKSKTTNNTRSQGNRGGGGKSNAQSMSGPEGLDDLLKEFRNAE